MTHEKFRNDSAKIERAAQTRVAHCANIVTKIVINVPYSDGELQDDEKYCNIHNDA
jgi:hypothetical protein